jgi:hypothetical protein
MASRERQDTRFVERDREFAEEVDRCISLDLLECWKSPLGVK